MFLMKRVALQRHKYFHIEFTTAELALLREDKYSLNPASRRGWQVHAYCLMGNHFHLVIETPQANLVAGMQWLLSTYTARFNRRHRRFGHLFSGRYKSLVIDGSGTGYLRTVCEYVHLNPVRAKLLTAEQPLRDYRWSSFGEYLKAPSRRPLWLRGDRVFGEMGFRRTAQPGGGDSRR